ncbi:MAG: bifunctional DNA-formamidopyrimidine glycosylase/DNA-(apurinic or apyrimidinic site) lyase [Pseudomonadales bacterium]|nr:bifunctional DNA-formamidopyrimidine glycosylase/DNA-(apurinic or apyrimidinic site) lyase [Pseudomonadales bacterium]
MPELPEVETTRRGIAAHLAGRRIEKILIHNRRLRWPVTPGLTKTLPGQKVLAISRRGKYLLLQLERGTLLIHLGMSGSLRLAQTGSARLKHDHIELLLDSGSCLRYCDPRRFGAWLWVTGDPHQHTLLAELGPEPLERHFSANYLLDRLSQRKQAIKTAIMDNHLVVGVGNIYANEALFRAGIHPLRPSLSLAPEECQRLVREIKQVLRQAIQRGGTTLRDFVGGDGKPGYFAQELLVYGRGGQGCPRCNTPLQEVRLGQRSTVFCSHCQH